MDIGIQIVILTIVLILLIAFLIWFLSHEEKKESVMDLFNPGRPKNDFINRGLEMKSIGGDTNMKDWIGAHVDIPRFIERFARYFLSRFHLPEDESPAWNTTDQNYEIIREFMEHPNVNIQSTSLRLIKAFKDIKDISEISDDFKLIMMNVLPEVFVIGEWKYNFSLVNIRYAGAGSFNTVFTLDIHKNNGLVNSNAVLRIYRENLGRQYEKHEKLLNAIRKIIAIFNGRNLVRLPIFSSIDAGHTFDVRFSERGVRGQGEEYSLVWQVLKDMKPLPSTLNLPQTKNYINMIYNILKLAHQNELIYLDWKMDNAMCDGDEVLLTDVDFLDLDNEINKLYRSHSLPTYFKEKDRQGKLNGYQSISEDLKILDNHIGIREMLLAIISMTGYFSEDETTEEAQAEPRLRSKRSYGSFMDSNWYETSVNIGNQTYNRFIASICSILDKDSTVDDKCVDFIFEYINAFLNIIDQRGVDDETFEERVDELIKKNQKKCREFQESYLERLKREPLTNTYSSNANVTPTNSPVISRPRQNGYRAPPSPTYIPPPLSQHNLNSLISSPVNGKIPLYKPLNNSNIEPFEETSLPSQRYGSMNNKNMSSPSPKYNPSVRGYPSPGTDSANYNWNTSQHAPAPNVHALNAPAPTRTSPHASRNYIPLPDNEPMNDSPTPSQKGRPFLQWNLRAQDNQFSSMDGLDSSDESSGSKSESSSTTDGSSTPSDIEFESLELTD